MKQKKLNFIFNISFINILFLLGILFFFTSCTNSFLPSFNLGALPTPGPSTSSTPQDTLVISTASVATSSSGTQTSATTTIFFDSIKSTVPVTNHCNLAGAAGGQNNKPCLCQFQWNQISIGGTIGASIAHTVQSPLITTQPNVVTCLAPALYNTEIVNGTQIKITIIPAPNNADAGTFQSNTFVFTKNPVATSGSFQDSQGHIFDNILRYSCYSISQRGLSVQNKIQVLTNNTDQSTLNAFIGSQFCVTTVKGGSTTTTTCPNLPKASYSSQNYYYNLYIRASERGDINKFNDAYICPQVKESLNNNGTVGTQNTYWPLDSSFALALGPSSTFAYGVTANTKLSIAGDSTVANSSCFQVSAKDNTPTTGGGGAGGTSLVQSCLGFAAVLNPDGSCPYFKDAFGQIRQTYRLRKFIAIYPRIFDTNGTPIAQPQSLDTIFVLDRPVKSPSTADPLKPYTMLGPKPCPFAFFDATGAANANPNGGSSSISRYPSYVASNSPHWAGVNIDGIEFPNKDEKEKSCSTTFPVLNSSGQFSMRTVNIFNGTSTNSNNSGPAHVYVRPIQPFLPHYEEDTTFQACAPQASPLQDPPLHFSRSHYNGNVAWCAEAYPTQNDNIQSIDPLPSPSPSPPTVWKATGMISPYTSHVKLNSASSTCSASLPNIPTVGNYNYPAFSPGTIPAYARHPGINWSDDIASNTCDRTVVANRSSQNSPSLDWPKFPLLAPSGDITDPNTGIQIDQSYHCLITYDNGSGKAQKSTPTDGCCNINSVFVPTGGGPLGAHLEPDVPCKTPAY